MRTITVGDLNWFCTEPNFCNVELFNNDIGEVVFSGMLSEVPQCYRDYEVQSFDPVMDDEKAPLCLNIGNKN